MYRNSGTENPERNEPAHAPSHCPACGSRNVQTTSKIVTAATYWRCQSCGEVWNVGRRQAADRYNWR